MRIGLFSGSAGFTRHATASFGREVEMHVAHPSVARLPYGFAGCALMVIHATSAGGQLERLSGLVAGRDVPMAVAADVPDLAELLELSRLGIRGYFNSYMTDVHYRQMASLVAAGQSWFSPPLMTDVLALARATVRRQSAPGEHPALDGLTRREREIALDASSAKTNREIAAERRIAERTVKAHLTNVFRKLKVRDRRALAALLHASEPLGAPSQKS